MTLTALIGTYETGQSGSLRALVPLAGRPLAEYQVRMLAAAGAAPIVLLADEPPAALLSLIDRLRGEGLPVVLAQGVEEAAARFEADHDLLLVADGIAPDLGDLATLAAAKGPAVVTLPDKDAYEAYERIDLANRWAGLAKMKGEDVGATAAMLGDWDLPSTLLRRTIQSGAMLVPASGKGTGPLLVETEADAQLFSQRLLGASRAARIDWVARFVTPKFEDWLTERFSALSARPGLVAATTPMLLAGSAAAFIWGQMLLGAALLFASIPFDLVGRRIAQLRFKPIAPSALSEIATRPLFLFTLFCFSLGVAVEAGWGALALGLALVIAAHFGDVVRDLAGPSRFDVAAFRRRPASFLLLPLVAAGWELVALCLLTAYALASALWSAHGAKG